MMRTDTLPGRAYAPDIDGRTRRPRSNVLPEDSYYVDKGCEISPRCLECPLSICKDDVPGELAMVRRRMRDLQIIQYVTDGFKPTWIARVMGISRRTVHKVLESAEQHLTDSVQTRYTDTDIAIIVSTNGGDNGRR